MAEALEALYPGVKLGIGPAIDGGFYYDVDMDYRLSDDDLTQIENKMKEIIKENLTIERKVFKKDAAIKFFIYTLAGSVLTFAGVLYLAYFAYAHSPLQAFTFDMRQLTELGRSGAIPAGVQWWLFAAFAAGFLARFAGRFLTGFSLAGALCGQAFIRL